MKIELTVAERQALKARAHALHPTVMIGAQGLTDAIVKACDAELKAHELIKVKVAGDDRAAREAALLTLAERLNAAAVQHIGKVLVLWRPREEALALPPPAKPPRPKRATRASLSPQARVAPKPRPQPQQPTAKGRSAKAKSRSGKVRVRASGSAVRFPDEATKPPPRSQPVAPVGRGKAGSARPPRTQSTSRRRAKPAPLASQAKPPQTRRRRRTPTE